MNPIKKRNLIGFFFFIIMNEAIEHVYQVQQTLTNHRGHSNQTFGLVLIQIFFCLKGLD